jgi:predicted nucleic acid-binding protein
MRGPLILDTGALVALVDRSEQRHVDCTAVLEAWTGQVASTEAVLTETLHLLRPLGWRAQKSGLNFFLRGVFTLVPASAGTLLRANALMEQYRDLPMDYADATLVALAEELRSSQIFTLDRKGFSVYRLYGRQSVEIFP